MLQNGTGSFWCRCNKTQGPNTVLPTVLAILVLHALNLEKYLYVKHQYTINAKQETEWWKPKKTVQSHIHAQPLQCNSTLIRLLKSSGIFFFSEKKKSITKNNSINTSYLKICLLFRFKKKIIIMHTSLCITLNFTLTSVMIH